METRMNLASLCSIDASVGRSTEKARAEEKIALEDIGRRQARKNAIKIVAKMDKKFASGEGKKSKFQEKKILAANLKTKKRNCVDHLKCHSTRLLEREIFSLKFKQH